MNRPDTNQRGFTAWRIVAAAAACLVLLGTFVAVGHAHDQQGARDADCVFCSVQQTLSFEAPGVDTAAPDVEGHFVEAEASDDPVVDQQVRLAPLRGPPSPA